MIKSEAFIAPIDIKLELPDNIATDWAQKHLQNSDIHLKKTWDRRGITEWAIEENLRRIATQLVCKWARIG